jgi:tRNA-specific 2-thiouridylase
MSGGVDSSVAAKLLLDDGHELVGVFMRHGEESAAACDVSDGPNPLLPLLQGRADHKQGCCSASDAADARRVADRLDIPFYSLDMQSDFRRIVDYFVEEYQSGRTPNPCVQCNNWIKFGSLFDYADDIGAEYVATGHYAQIKETQDPENPFGIYRGIDSTKDQAYVLAGIDRRFLSRMLLPVGGYEKTRIRELAAEVGLRVATKKDSQEICFVTSGKHGDFIRQRSGVADTSGDFVTTDGTVLGTHPGIEQFTIGQRKGLGIAMGEPHYVTKIDAETRQVTLGPRSALARTRLIADGANWLENPPRLDDSISVQIRYNSAPQPATVELNNDDSFVVQFDEPCDAVSPGQVAVVFRGGRVLGGGWIKSAE